MCIVLSCLITPISVSLYILKKIVCGDAFVHMGARCSSAHGAMGHRIDGSLDRSFIMDPFSYFSFQPVLHDWCNKGCGVCYFVCGMMHIKELLLLIGKSSLCGGSRFPRSLSVWSFPICLTPYNRK